MEISRLKWVALADEKVFIPYRTGWEKIRKKGERIGSPGVKTYRGGARGGGGTELTEEGKKVLREYYRFRNYLETLSKDEEHWEALDMKISARNMIKGVVKDVEKGDVAASVKIEICTPVTLTAVITKEAVEDLDIKVGDEVKAVIKATEVMISKK